MMTVWYPFNKAPEVAKKVLSFPKLPSSIKKWQIFATADGKKGIKGYNLIMTEGDQEEAAKFIVKSMQPFTRDIEGYVWKLETVVGVRDALEVLGMKP
ncbi:MAG: hypothetical protein ACFFDK_16960 [Promethearchaeota archaeon]